MFIISLFLFFLTLIYFFKIYNQQKNTKIIIKENKQIIKKLQSNKFIKDEEFLNIDKYYINLERAIDRKQKILDQFDNYNIKNYRRVEAYDYKKIKKNNFINEYNSSEGNIIEMVVTMSHIKAINSAYLDGKELAMIMEDDINLCTVPYWKIKLRNILRNIPEDCDFILLANNKFEEDSIKLKKANSSYSYATGVCYIVTKKGMEKVNKNFIRGDKIVFLREHNLKNQAIVFDRGFLNFFNLYYTSQSLFITEDFNQKSLIRNNFLKYENNISSKVLNYYNNLI